jgi:hypothetical protein
VSVSVANNNLQVAITDNQNHLIEQGSSPLSQVYSISYSGSSGGGDTFTNATSLSSSAFFYGGHNTETTSGAWNFVESFGDYNNLNLGSGGGVAFTFGGAHDTMQASSGVSVYSYDFNPYQYF